MFARRHWIPPAGLIFAQLAHGASWILLLFAALYGSLAAFDWYGIAWVHTVALGWATAAALSILLHVVPAFTDAAWRGERLVRACVFVFCAGVALFVGAALWARPVLPYGALLVVLALLTYSATAVTTLGTALRGERTERAIARAFIITFTFLNVAALIGLALAAFISGIGTPAWVGSLPASHATLGLFGWLSLLIFGVSARTVGPIAGNKSRFPWAHIAVGSFTLFGVPLLAIGIAWQPPLAWVGAALFAGGAAVYAFDIADIMRRATVTHRPPQAFVSAAVIWLTGGLVLGAGTLAGKPWSLAFGFVLLAGWVGQMINAHIHHIGVRLLLTIYRGEDDETRPQAVLDSRLSWIAFLAFQAAIVLGAAGLLTVSAPIVGTAAVAGLGGWLAMTANMLRARNAARHITAISLL